MELVIILTTLLNIALTVTVIVLLKKNKSGDLKEEFRSTRIETNSAIQSGISSLGEMQTKVIKSELENAEKRDRELKETLTDSIRSNYQHIRDTLEVYSEKLREINETLEKRVKSLEEANSKKLDEMKSVVDEKLQSTLEERISRSFKEVSERLEQVYRGLGEMQNIATSVGDLKKTLSNVKARGILGEIQLGAILEDMLSPEQYERNVVTVKGSRDPVEFAIKLPGGSEDSTVYLPIDSKFPLDAYNELNEAYESADNDRINQAKSTFVSRVKKFADDIHKKYVSPPDTTEFAIMFLPTEGLYAEAVRLGMVEILQEKYKISIAGPTTMAALLNSLQMGFKTLAIQKRSGEVWETLSAVKTEFEKFETVLVSAQTKLNQTSNELEKLVGTRTNAIRRKLRSITAMTDDNATAYFSLPDGDESDT